MNSYVKTIGITIMTSIIYVIIYWFFRKGLQFIPELYLWNSFESIVNIGTINLSIIDIIYLFFGLIVINHGVRNLILITKENHSAQNMETRQPNQLLTTGFYAKARHPMYGTFIIMSLGLFFPTRSLWGVLIILVVLMIQLINATIEERMVLQKIFGNQYSHYRNSISNRLFIPSYRKYIIIASCLTFMGLIFR